MTKYGTNERFISMAIHGNLMSQEWDSWDDAEAASIEADIKSIEADARREDEDLIQGPEHLKSIASSADVRMGESHIEPRKPLLMEYSKDRPLSFYGPFYTFALTALEDRLRMIEVYQVLGERRSRAKAEGEARAYFRILWAGFGWDSIPIETKMKAARL